MFALYEARGTIDEYRLDGTRDDPHLFTELQAKNITRHAKTGDN